MAGRNTDVQQIRFINGLECLANILHWEDDAFIEMNNALVMEGLEADPGDDRAYYMLKPLVSYTDDLSKSITVNPGSIMCVSEPSPTVMEQYKSSLREILNQIDDDPKNDSATNIVSFDSRKRLLTED
jgi:hypothetical protein